MTILTLNDLFILLQERAKAGTDVSYTAKLLGRGVNKVAQKVGEEAVEVVIEAVAGRSDGVISESADLLYHLLVLWQTCGVTPDAVFTELTRRTQVSGLEEKAARKMR